MESAAEGAAAAVLVPGSHKQTGERYGNQTEHDAAEQGFDHGVRHQIGCTILPRPQGPPRPDHNHL